MSHKITHDQKEIALEARRELGTLKAAALAADVSVRTLNNEMRRSAIFKKRMQEATDEGHRNVSDIGKQYLIDVVMGKVEKTDRNRVTAATILLNAYEPGFKGTIKVERKTEHHFRVETAVPRPKYDVEIEITKPKSLEKTQYEIDKERLKRLNAGTIEEAIEGEVIKAHVEE